MEYGGGPWNIRLLTAGDSFGTRYLGTVFNARQGGIRNPLADPGTTEAARKAMDITFLHWGLHPWGIYTLVALSLAFFSFNKGLPLSIRTAFYPLFGEKIHGGIGNAIDIMATVATLFGVATSLGLGVQQVNAGLDHLFGIGQTRLIQVSLIAGITAVATWSVVRGLDKGIRRISEVNIAFAAALALFVFLLGPTLFILDALLENIGYYLQHLPQLSTWNETYEQSRWQHGWTIFYWSWWIAWSPFVGMFIARVSYGRKIREFILGVMLVPTFVTFVWITIFGDIGINMPDHLIGAPAEVPVGSGAACIGFAYGFYHFYTQVVQQAVISSKFVSPNGTNLILFDAAVPEGTRGGPLVSLYDGRVVGVVGGRFDPKAIMAFHTGDIDAPPPTLSYAVSIEYGGAMLEAEGVSSVI